MHPAPPCASTAGSKHGVLMPGMTTIVRLWLSTEWALNRCFCGPHVRLGINEGVVEGKRGTFISVIFILFIKTFYHTLGGTPDAAHARCGDLATYPDQAAVVTTKGFSLHTGSFRRGESVGRSGKMRRKTIAWVARGADTPPCNQMLFVVT